jgi:hypothetical protein
LAAAVELDASAQRTSDDVWAPTVAPACSMQVRFALVVYRDPEQP